VWVFIIFVALDTICIGMGMGVPIFCILLGFPVGWFIVKYITTNTTSISQVYRRVLVYALLTSAITLLWMVAIWGPTVSIIFDPSRDIANFGIPMILYEPLASFIGWIVLMMMISPFLQLLTTIFGSYLALMRWVDHGAITQQKQC
jgi:hypothetical protein